jgi:hypothetical protein
MSEKCGRSLRILIKVEFSKELMNLSVVQGQNEHNSKNQNNYVNTIIFVYTKD